MDGWEFIQEYNKLDKKYHGNVIVVMLTTSINPDDRYRSLEMAGLNDFMNKPLTRVQFTEIIRKNFPQLAAEMG